MERNKTGTALYVLTGLVALAALATMFFRYIVVRGVDFRRTGWGIFQSGNALNIILVSLMIASTIAVVIISFGRAGGAFDSHRSGNALVFFGVSMAVLSFIIFMTATRIAWPGFNHVYRRGGGLITNLILANIVAALSFLPLVFDRRETHHRHRHHHA